MIFSFPIVTKKKKVQQGGEGGCDVQKLEQHCPLNDQAMAVQMYGEDKVATWEECGEGVNMVKSDCMNLKLKLHNRGLLGDPNPTV